MARAFEKFIPVPQKNGTIMVIEKEFGPVGADDWVNIAAGLADIVKCTFGTASLYNEEILQEKVEIYQQIRDQPHDRGDPDGGSDPLCRRLHQKVSWAIPQVRQVAGIHAPGVLRRHDLHPR